MRGAALIILAMVVASAYSQINPAGCGKRPRARNNGADDYNKVVGGQEAKPFDWGWQVEIRSGSTGGSLFCGGSLINHEWVLCAAHCTINRAPGTFRVVAGHHDRNTGVNAEILTTTRVINHPSYNSGNFQNDVSLIKVTPTNVNDDNIIPVCLANTDEDYTTHPNQVVTVTGWGTITGGGLAVRLQEVNVPITSYTDCKNFYGATLIHEPSMICAGAIGDGKDTCQGDSGGPVNHFDAANNVWRTIGITSWGRGCGDIGVYTRVSSFVNWIRTTIQNN